MKNFVMILLVLLITGCSSIVSSTAVFIVAKHSEKVELETRKYKRIDKCFIGNRPEAFELAEAIAYGSPITEQYKILLNPEFEEKDPIEPLSLAYAYYYVADKLNDTRAQAKLKWLEPYMELDKATEIRKFIDTKFLKSYLGKCFDVNESFEKKVRTIDLVR